MKQKGIGNMVCEKTQFYYDSQKEVQPTISLDGERERKKQSKQKKQSLLAAMLLVSAQRQRERERERADDGQTKVSFASREPKKCASGNQGIFLYPKMNRFLTIVIYFPLIYLFSGVGRVPGWNQCWSIILFFFFPP
jgi:hypothetical protein